MNEPKWYFTLKAKGHNAFHERGSIVCCTESSLHIGETADCDVRYESGRHLPERYASIVRNEDGQSWRIVKRSTHATILIEGRGETGYAAQLHDGDLIRFDNQAPALRFNTHHDARYGERRKPGGKWLGGILIAGCLAIVSAMALWPKDKGNEITEQELTAYESSICYLRVDSVQYVEQAGGRTKLLKPTKKLTDDMPVGTAFLTTDSTLVTARHCVEYWLGSNLDLTTKLQSLAEDDIVRWAIEAESFNHDRTEADTMHTLRVFFSIYDFLGEKKYSFCSTDSCVHTDKTHDGVFLLADFEEDYYWRSIRPYFNDTRMASGDLLWIDHLPECGQLRLASRDELSKLKRGQKLMACGYPITGMNDHRVTFASGALKQDAEADTELLFVEANINHGFSGGPILQRTRHGIVCTSVVSRVDSVSSGLYKWAVSVGAMKK